MFSLLPHLDCTWIEERNGERITYISRDDGRVSVSMAGADPGVLASADASSGVNEVVVPAYWHQAGTP
jgi:hypothetical protein